MTNSRIAPASYRYPTRAEERSSGIGFRLAYVKTLPTQAAKK
jgi:hypothetical protein